MTTDPAPLPDNYFTRRGVELSKSPRIPEEHMAVIHTIRQDFAKALAAYEGDMCTETSIPLEDQRERRARAIRMIRDEDNMSIRDLAAIFRCSKAAVRTALNEGDQ